MAEREGGGWPRWPAWLSRATRAGGVDAATDPGAPGAWQPTIRRGWRHTELQFTGGVSQSRMLTFRPGHLLIDYTRTMMAALLFNPRPAMIGMVGLGGGSQAKFCHRCLPQARLEVVENNPHVIAMRRRFRIPDDDARLQVVLGDGAQFLHDRRGRYDLLLVDGYDETGIPEALSSQRFQDDCRAALAPGGVLASNLYATDVDRHVARLQRSFGRDRVWLLGEKRQSNRVAFAWTGEPFPGGRIDLPAIEALIPRAAARELRDVFATVAQAWHAR